MSKKGSKEELEEVGCVFGSICFTFSVVLAIWFAVKLPYGLESALQSHEGTLVGASVFCDTSDQSSCVYYVNKRFEYANSTRHCTVRSFHKFPDREFAENALGKVELGVTEMIWLKPMFPHSCYDEEVMNDNFKDSMLMLKVSLILFAIGCFFCCGIPSCSGYCSESSPTIRHVPLRQDEEQGAVEMVNVVAVACPK